MRKTAKLLALAMCAALVLCLFAACGQENEPNVPSDVDADVDTNEETFEFTVAARPAEGDLVTTTMSWFAEEIEARSDGRIKLDLQYNGVLCSQGTEFEALESGNLRYSNCLSFVQLQQMAVPWLGNCSGHGRYVSGAARLPGRDRGRRLPGRGTGTEQRQAPLVAAGRVLQLCPDGCQGGEPG